MTSTHSQTQTTGARSRTEGDPLVRVAARAEACSCDDPIPVQRAERKGAAISVCLRCGLRVPARLR